MTHHHGHPSTRRLLDGAGADARPRGRRPAASPPRRRCSRPWSTSRAHRPRRRGLPDRAQAARGRRRRPPAGRRRQRRGGRAAQRQGRGPADPQPAPGARRPESWRRAHAAPRGRPGASAPRSTRPPPRRPRRGRGGRGASALEGGFVAGQESALVNQLDGRPAVPARPARPGHRARRRRPPDPGAQRRDAGPARAARPVRRRLVPLGGHRRGARHAPGHRQRRGRAARAWSRRRAAAALATCWPPAEPGAPGRPCWSAATTAPGCRRRASTSGSPRSDAGAVRRRRRRRRAARARRRDLPARVRAPRSPTYLAGESRRPVRPVPQRAAADGRRPAPAGRRASATAGLPAEIERMRRSVNGRGACAHPDGTARFVASAPCDVFARPRRPAHLEGWCPQPAIAEGVGDDPPARRLDPLRRPRRCAELLPELLDVDDWGYPMSPHRRPRPRSSRAATRTPRGTPCATAR